MCQEEISCNRSWGPFEPQVSEPQTTLNHSHPSSRCCYPVYGNAAAATHLAHARVHKKKHKQEQGGRPMRTLSSTQHTHTRTHSRVHMHTPQQQQQQCTGIQHAALSNSII